MNKILVVIACSSVAALVGCAGGRNTQAPVYPYNSPTAQVLPPGTYPTTPPVVTFPAQVSQAPVLPPGSPSDLPFGYPIGQAPVAQNGVLQPGIAIAPQGIQQPYLQPIAQQPVTSTQGIPLKQLYPTKPIFDFSRGR